MNLRLLPFSILLVAPLAGHAQTHVPAVPATVYSYFTADFQPAAGPDSTTYCVETIFRDSLGGITKVYYPSGRLRQFIPYANVQRRILHGTLTNWYEDGRMRTKEDYLAGQRDGELLTFYPDGSPKRREHYTQGRGSVGTCYGPDGSVVPFFAYEQLPLYPGGEEELTKELTRGVRLNPKEMTAMRREAAMFMRARTLSYLKRKVYVELTVNEDGRIAAAKVVQSNTAFLNDAALRSATQLKRQFLPARRDGQIVKSHYTVAVSYTLEQPYQQPQNPATMTSMRNQGRMW